MIQDSGLRTNYGLIQYCSYNIGDEIQSIAARRFIPHVDYYVYRENLNIFHADNNVKMLLNAWYAWYPYNFPPSSSITPLLISMHFCREMQNVIAHNKHMRNYLTEKGPVGCRDKFTMNFLLSLGIPAYFSGCMTTTLLGNPKLKAKNHDEYVLCVDVPDDVLQYVRSVSVRPVYSLYKNITSFFDSMERFEIAKIMLFLYHNAFSVVTPNLHTALPCLAFGTPVCFLDQEVYDGRLDGIYEWLNHCRREKFLEGNFYDVNNPPENPKEFLKFREAIADKCRNFTGYDASCPTLPDDYSPDIFAIIRMLAISDAKNGRAVRKAKAVSVADIFLRRLLNVMFPRVFKNIINLDG